MCSAAWELDHRCTCIILQKYTNSGVLICADELTTFCGFQPAALFLAQRRVRDAQAMCFFLVSLSGFSSIARPMSVIVC